MSYTLTVMSFDGETKRETGPFATIADAWEHSSDMGSRWYFYPWHFVTTKSGQTVVAAPEGLEQFSGRRVATVAAIFKALSALPEMQGADVDAFGMALQGATL